MGFRRHSKEKEMNKLTDREFLDIFHGQPNSSVIPMCNKCLIPADYDEEHWLYRCPKCKAEGCLIG